MLKSALKYEKVTKSFGGIKKTTYLRGVHGKSLLGDIKLMAIRRRKKRGSTRWVITAINPLTGEREVCSLPMTRIEAITAIKRDIEANAGRDDRSFVMARVQEYEPNQLTLW